MALVKCDLAIQVYELSGQFLPKDWIMDKWEEGFYITAMAGSSTGERRAPQPSDLLSARRELGGSKPEIEIHV